MTLLLPLLGCPTPESAPAETTRSWTDADGATLTAAPDGRLSWEGRAVTVGFGFVDEVDPDFNYDPWNLYDPDLSYAIPSGLTWALPVAIAEDGTLTLDNGETATLAVDEAGPGLRLSLSGADAPYAFVRVGVADDEAFYGLGEIFEGVEHRGAVRPMQIEIDVAYESVYNEVHVPVPLLVSSAGWGLLADSRWPGVFDVAATRPDTVEAVFNGAGLTFDLYAPGTPAEVTARYHQRTGMPEIPPIWAFAPVQWRNVVADESVVLADAEAIRSLGLPTGVIWVDNPWQSTYNSMIPDPEQFPNWTSLIETLHDQGFRMLAWTTPYLEEADPDHATYAANGWFLDAPILFNQFGDMIDLTQADAMAAWQERVAAARDIGIEGWKLDYGEDIQLGVGTGRVRWSFANGEDERTMHHDYTRYFHEAYSAPYAGEGVLIGRAGVLGGHTVTDIIWPGDLDNGFERFGDEGCDELLCVGGLPSAIRGGTGLAASGYPFFASDTGGYRGGRPSKESFIRWMEYAAILPIWQYGGAGENHNPWDFTDYDGSRFDEETLEAFRRYAELHIRLFPYYWHYTERLAETGLPFVQAQGYAFPEAGHHPEDAFLVGDDLFVAPVEVEGAMTRTLTLPPGGWIHWWTGARHEGQVTVDAPLGEGPLFLREGGAVPMLRRSVVTLSPAGEGVDSWDTDKGALNARIVPEDGAGFALSTGEAIEVLGDALTLTDGSLYTGWDLEIWAPGATGAEVAGVPVDATIDGPWVRVVLPAGTGAVTVR